MMRTKFKIKDLPDDEIYKIATFADYTRAATLGIKDYIITNDFMERLINDAN